MKGQGQSLSLGDLLFYNNFVNVLEKLGLNVKSEQSWQLLFPSSMLYLVVVVVVAVAVVKVVPL